MTGNICLDSGAQDNGLGSGQGQIQKGKAIGVIAPPKTYESYSP